MYHSVSPATTPDPYLLRVHPTMLDAQLHMLRRLRLRGVSLGTLLRAHDRGASARMVGLTFDDGYVDFLSHAAPVLARHGMTATVYVVSDGWRATTTGTTAPASTSSAPTSCARWPQPGTRSEVTR